MSANPNPRILEWAMERAGETPESLAPSFAKIGDWLDGSRVPTFRQTEDLARRLHVLPVYLYGDETPDLSLQIPDFRTITGVRRGDPSPELFDVVNQMLYRRGWMSDYLKSIDMIELAFVGSETSASDVHSVADSIRSLLGLESRWAESLNKREAVASLRRAIEKVGVFVCAGSYYADSTRRKFLVEEFRGFALSDPYAPMIFLNTNDELSAQLFTLSHEFAHLMLGQTGVDDATSEVREPKRGEESFCDAIAAELLVPSEEAERAFSNHRLDAALDVLQRQTKASYITCLRRGYELGFLSSETFYDSYDTYMEDYERYRTQLMTEEMRDREERNDGAGRSRGGPSFYVLKRHHLGMRLTETVYLALKADFLSYTDAYELTNMRPSTFAKYYRQEGFDV